VDDGSTGGSGMLCDEYAARDSRVRVIHQSNKGLWAARNAGQDAANGDFLFFPDADDYFHYDMIRLMNHYLLRRLHDEIRIS
jgi:glycosyltransferase involved in cell wall biosynthesis